MRILFLSTLLLLPLTVFSQTVLFSYSTRGNLILKATNGYEGIIKSQTDSTFGCLRYVVACASDGDTIKYQIADIDTSFMKAPLSLNKSITLRNSPTVAAPWISYDFDLPGFDTSNFGINIPFTSTITLQAINLRNINNIAQKYLIKNEGILILDHVRISGDSQPFVINLGFGEIRVVNGLSEMKPD